MSRSYKRPYFTDYRSKAKSWSSRRFRRKVNQILTLEKKGYLGEWEILRRYFMEWNETEDLIHLIGDDEPEFPHPK